MATAENIESAFVDVLDVLLCDEDGDAWTGGRIKSVETFAGAGVLTTNRGLVLTLSDGSEFQISIVQSRCGRDEE